MALCTMSSQNKHLSEHKEKKLIGQRIMRVSWPEIRKHTEKLNPIVARELTALQKAMYDSS